MVLNRSQEKTQTMRIQSTSPIAQTTLDFGEKEESCYGFSQSRRIRFIDLCTFLKAENSSEFGAPQYFLIFGVDFSGDVHFNQASKRQHQ
jgi:hypothetical protein